MKCPKPLQNYTKNRQKLDKMPENAKKIPTNWVIVPPLRTQKERGNTKCHREKGKGKGKYQGQKGKGKRKREMPKPKGKREKEKGNTKVKKEKEKGKGNIEHKKEGKGREFDLFLPNSTGKRNSR